MSKFPYIQETDVVKVNILDCDREDYGIAFDKSEFYGSLFVNDTQLKKALKESNIPLFVLQIFKYDIKSGQILHRSSGEEVYEIEYSNKRYD